IEKKMVEVVKADYPFVREEVSRTEAKRRFKDDPLKLERIEDLGPNEVISVYTDGPFVDLCRGPHVPSTGRIKHFKLLHAAGAFWRGDERRQMLQRIYGTAWFQGRPRGLPAAPRGGQEARPPGAGEAARSVLDPGGGGPGAGVLAPEGRDDPAPAAALHRGHDSGARLFAGLHAQRDPRGV